MIMRSEVVITYKIEPTQITFKYHNCLLDTHCCNARNVKPGNEILLGTTQEEKGSEPTVNSSNGLEHKIPPQD